MRDDDSDNLRRRAWKVREAGETTSKQKAAFKEIGLKRFHCRLTKSGTQRPGGSAACDDDVVGALPRVSSSSVLLVTLSVT